MCKRHCRDSFRISRFRLYSFSITSYKKEFNNFLFYSYLSFSYRYLSFLWLPSNMINLKLELVVYEALPKKYYNFHKELLQAYSSDTTVALATTLSTS